MNFRWPGFLAWLVSSPITFPPTSPVSKLSLFRSLLVCRRSSLLTGEGGRGGRWAKSYHCKKAWSSVNNSILSALSYDLKNLYVKFVSVFLFPLFGIMTTDDVCRTYLKALFIIFSISKYVRTYTSSKSFFESFLMIFKSSLFNIASSAARPSDSTVSKDAGIEPRTVVLRLWYWLSDAHSAKKIKKWAIFSRI